MTGHKKEFTLTWIIENYSFCDRKNGCYFLSPKFKAEHFGGSEWNILLYPRGMDWYSNENLCVHIRKVPSQKEKLSVDLAVDICSTEGDVFLAAEKKATEGEYSFPKGLKSEEVEKKMANSIEDTLVVRCRLGMEERATEKNTPACHICSAEGDIFLTTEKKTTGGDYSFPKGLKSEEVEKKMADTIEDTLFVRCRMGMEEGETEKNTPEINYLAKTTIDFDRYSFMWDLEYDESSDMLMKRTFVGMKETQFEISLKAFEDDVVIVIERTRENSRRCPAVKCHIFLINCEGIEITSCVDFYFFDSDSEERNAWSFPNFFKKSLLEEHVWLTMKFTFFVSNGIKFSRYIQE